MILYYINEKNFFVITDTLVKDYNTNKLIKFSSKVYTIPHLDSLIFGIGVENFTKSYYDNILNVISDDIEYFKIISKRICIDNYHSLKLHIDSVYVKVFFIHRIKEQIKFISFCSDNNFEPIITDEAIGLFPQNELVTKQLIPLLKDKIEIRDVLNIIKDHEPQLSSGGEYFLHMYSGENALLITKIGESSKYQSDLNKMIQNSSIFKKNTEKSFYFDQNIWGNLLDEVKNNDTSILKEIINRIDEGKMFIAYSSVNIKETRRRTIDFKIKEELSLIKKLSNCIYVTNDYRFNITDPYEIFEQQTSDNDPTFQGFYDSFKRNFDNLITKLKTQDIPDDPLVSKKLNNISPDEIFNHIDELINTYNKDFDSESNNFSDIPIQEFCKENLQLLIDYLENSFKFIKHPTINLEIQKIKESISNMDQQTFKPIVANPNIQNFDIDKIFKDNGIKDDILPGVLNGFLEASNYHPDSKKLKKKKGVIIDEDDMSHLNYSTCFDYFVTEDTKLINRFNAVKNKLEIETVILI
ncbi:MAG: hypothetical protein GY756_17885 [bacterium]|nr:hypothetical protein [bacterium]